MGFAGVIALLVALAVVGVGRMARVAESIDLILGDRYAKVALAHALENAVNQQGRALRTALIAVDIAIVKEETAKIGAADEQIAKTIEVLRAGISGVNDATSLDTLVRTRAAYQERQSELLKLVESQSIDEGASFLVKDLLPVQNAYLAAIDTFTRSQVEGMQNFGARAQATASSAKTLLIVLASAATTLAVGVAFALTRSITVPISQAVTLAETVASGDLRSRLEVNRSDETGLLLAALERMNVGLAEIVVQVRLSSDSVATGSAQIAAGNADLSQRTEQQASNLQRTTSSMEQIAKRARLAAETARTAAASAAAASETAAEGGRVVRQLVETMNQISVSSRRISEITAVIDEIVFQTSILASNAATQAARAGESGRGFGVVATEVRALAQRAGMAAKEIRSLIGDSTVKVDAGSKLVANAAATIDNVVRRVDHVSKLIGEIDSATQEQADSIADVGAAVAQIDQGTQQNAALVEESAAAATSLNQQAVRLTGVVGAFKLP